MRRERQLGLGLALGLCGCASYAERPPLEVLPARVAPEDSPIRLPEAVVEAVSPRLEMHLTPAEGGYPQMVRVVMPSAPTVVMLLAFPVPGTPGTLGLEALSLDLARRAFIGGLPAGADGYGRSTGTMLSLKTVSLPSQVEKTLRAFRRAFDEKRVFKSYRRHRFDFLQSLVASKGVAQTLVRIGRYGPDHPWAQGPAARVAALSSVSVERVKKAWRELFDLRRAVLVIIGPEAGWPSAKTVLEGLPAGDPSSPFPEMVPPPPVPPLTEEDGRQFHALWFRNDQLLLQALHVGPGPRHPDYPAFLLLQKALGGFSSEGNRSLRHQAGASYGIDATLTTRRGATELMYGGWVDASRGMDLYATHQRVVKRVREEGVTVSELERARAQLMGSWARRLEEPEFVAVDLAECALRGQAPTLDVCLAPPDVTVPRERIREVAQRYLDPDRGSWLVYGEMDHVRYPLEFEGVISFYKIERPDPPD